MKKITEISQKNLDVITQNNGKIIELVELSGYDLVLIDYGHTKHVSLTFKDKDYESEKSATEYGGTDFVKIMRNFINIVLDWAKKYGKLVVGSGNRKRTEYYHKWLCDKMRCTTIWADGSKQTGFVVNISKKDYQQILDNKEWLDRSFLKDIHNYIDRGDFKIIHSDNNLIDAVVKNSSKKLIVNKNNSQIIYDDKPIKLRNIDDEIKKLFNKLVNLKENMKIIRLTENDLEKIVRRIIKENKFEDYMAYPSEEGLLLKVYELADIMGHGEDSEMPVGDFSDLSEAAVYLEDEMYDGNHGSVIEKKIHDLLTNIYEIIGYPDEEFEDDDFDEEDYMEDMDWVKSITVPGFTKEELYEIKERVIRLLSPGFHEDYEVGAYLSSVADEDPKIEKLLVKWLKSQGVNFYQPEYRDYMSKKNKN